MQTDTVVFKRSNNSVMSIFRLDQYKITITLCGSQKLMKFKVHLSKYKQISFTGDH